MARRLLVLALIPLSLLVIVLPAQAQNASPTANRPAPPGQPAAGPGGSEYVYTAVRVTSLGDDAGGGRVFEPTTDAAPGTPGAPPSLPLVLLLDGCCYKPEGSTVSGGGGNAGGARRLGER
jgi:hypothetical protein